jgi:16S rRNA (guanine527-N7)-methyltransferase
MMVDGGHLPAWLDVSRETTERLIAFAQLVERWTPAINLISKATVPNIWNRHILDSAQLYSLSPSNTGHWCDLGSGGGFPGIVIAAMARDERPAMQVTLVESDRRKAVFLSEAIRSLDLRARVLSQRIEDIAPLSADVISARALAPLSDLCSHAHRHLRPGGVAIFPKGANAEGEIAAARKDWSFNVAVSASKTDPQSVIVIMKDLQRG